MTVTNTDSADVVVQLTYAIAGPTTSAVPTVSGLAVPAKSSVTNNLAPTTLSSLNIGPGTNTVTVKASDGSATATCPDQPVLKVFYDKVVIDTYAGAPTPTLAPGNNFVDLFGPAGDTSTANGLGGFNLWSPAAPFVSAALASDGGTAPDRPTGVTPSYSNYAYVQYTGGVVPGDTYYVRSRLVLIGDTMQYAIRLLTSPGSSYSPADLAVFLPPTATTDSPVPGGEGVPTVFTDLQLNAPVGRNLAAGGVHWFRFSLP